MSTVSQTQCQLVRDGLRFKPNIRTFCGVVSQIEQWGSFQKQVSTEESLQ